MMLSNVESGKCNGSDSSSGRLLLDIEEISRALYLHKTPPNNVISPSDRRSKSAGKARFGESNSRIVNEYLLHEDKKSSIWNWKPLKALTNIRNRQFSCWFFLHVHTIEGLPKNFNDVSFCVQWKRKDKVMQTRRAQVCLGVAEFQETLVHRCSVYRTRNGHNQSVKYEPKIFSLYASVIGAPGVDMGKRWIDLTKLLPLTLEDLERDKSSGRCTTSFKLTGKAEGAMLNVSFGFSVTGDNSLGLGSDMIIPKIVKESSPSTVDYTVNFGLDGDSGMLQKVGRVPSNSNYGSHRPSQSLDVEIPNEVFPNQGLELAHSITFLCQKLDEAKLCSSQEFDFFSEEPLKPKAGNFPEFSHDTIENEWVNTEFNVTEQGMELSIKEQLKLEGAAQPSDDCAIETIDVAEIFKDDEATIDAEMVCDSIDNVYGNFENHSLREDSGCEGNDVCAEALMIEELDLVKYNISISKYESVGQENYTKNRSSYKAGKMVRSLSLDDVTECIANDFFRMLAMEQNPSNLGADSEPESPRELLFRQFEKEALASGDFFFNFDGEEECVELGVSCLPVEQGYLSDNFDSQLVIQAAEKDDDHKSTGQSLRSKRHAKVLENLETEALMKEWGFNECAFLNSPCNNSGGFGSPIYLPAEEPLEFPPLGEGLGPVIRRKDGGFLRSMNPSLFRNAKNGGRLIMQGSTAVVLPMAMGSSIMEILQHWASVGFEKMSMQVNKLMPLEDIRGKMMQQVPWEVAPRMEARMRLSYLQQESEDGQDSVIIRKEEKESPFDWDYKDLTSSLSCGDIDSNCFSLEDLTPLAMNKIEGLLIEGLRIQSGMSDGEAPSRIRPQSIGITSAFLGNNNIQDCGPFILEEAAGLRLSEKDKDDRVDELINLSLTLDEWTKLDAGIFEDKDKISERTSNIIAAYLAENMDFISGMLTRCNNWYKPSGRSCGLLGNNFTVALRVQLRDPLRDFEIVGAPMLALVEVERIFADLKPRVHSRVSERSDEMEEDDIFKQVMEGVNAEGKQEKRIEEGMTWFKINEVHVAGFNTENGKKHQWHTTTQEQSGARWLLGSGMGRNKRHLYLKSNAIVKSSAQSMRKTQPQDTVWSISSHVHGPRAKWKELATLNLHIRNPDVIFLT